LLIAFEICHGPAIGDPAKRRFFVQAAAEFISASGGVRPKPTLVLSSGSRTTLTLDKIDMQLEYSFILFEVYFYLTCVHLHLICCLASRYWTISIKIGGRFDKCYEV
jgi:hypothetical protein